MSKFTTIEERFWAKVLKTESCWLWTASRWDNGYGRLNVHGEDTPAHRFSWQLHRGEIPDKLWVLHKCDVRQCVNPAHLFLGTPKDNMVDKCEKGRHRVARGRQQSAAKLDEIKVVEIRLARLAGKLDSESAEKYDISPALVSKVCRRKAWKHVLEPIGF